MAKTLNQIVTQDNQNNLPKRVIVQFTDDVEGNQQSIVNYDSMTTEQKSTYDAFISMCTTIMNT